MGTIYHHGLLKHPILYFKAVDGFKDHTSFFNLKLLKIAVKQGMAPL